MWPHRTNSSMRSHVPRTRSVMRYLWFSSSFFVFLFVQTQQTMEWVGPKNCASFRIHTTPFISRAHFCTPFHIHIYSASMAHIPPSLWTSSNITPFVHVAIQHHHYTTTNGFSNGIHFSIVAHTIDVVYVCRDMCVLFLYYLYNIYTFDTRG